MKNCLYLIVFLSFLLISLKPFAQSMVKGMVYADENRNNRKEKREKGLSGVAVSNGSEVVLTNAKGEYELPGSEDQIIFVIKPAGYALHLNEFNQPRFYYIHKPNGSPVLRYAGTGPTGELPESVDFALIPGEESGNFRVLVFGDPQPYTEQEMDLFSRAVVDELIGVENVSFGISLGDLVGDRLDLFAAYKAAVRPIGVPWYNVMGNHDENYDVQADSLSDETYERHFGPATYAFNYGKAHFIVLDDILYPDPRDGKGYWGGFRKDQLDFIEKDLKLVPKDHLIILAFHIPMREAGWEDTFREEDRIRLFELLKDFPYTLSMSAHTHIQAQDFFSAEDGWLQDAIHHHYNAGTTSGDWYKGQPDERGIPLSTMRDGTPRGYAFLNIEGNRYTIDYRVAGKSQDYQMEIYSPMVVEQNMNTSAGIYVNFFMGSEYDSVFFRVGKGVWKKMSRISDYDPSYLHLLHEWDFASELPKGRRPSHPVDCHHLWYAPIPVNLPAGEQIIEVKATDLFGRTFTGTGSYRVVVRP